MVPAEAPGAAEVRGDDVLREQLEQFRFKETPQSQAIDAIMVKLDGEEGDPEKAYELMQESITDGVLQEKTLPTDLLRQIIAEDATDAIQDMEKASGPGTAAKLRKKYQDAGIIPSEAGKTATLTDKEAARQAGKAITQARAAYPA